MWSQVFGKCGVVFFMLTNNHESIFQHFAFIMCVFCSTARDKRVIYAFLLSGMLEGINVEKNNFSRNEIYVCVE